MDGTSKITAPRKGILTRIGRLRRRRMTVRRAVMGFAAATVIPTSGALAVSEDVAVEAVLPAGEAAIVSPDLIEMDSAEFDVSEVGDVTDEMSAEIAEVIGAGEASWYGPRFAGRSTANGETFDPSELTAAHRTLPFGTLLRVTSKATGKSVIVRINDRGPYHGNRIIDLSEAAAKAIGIKKRGKGHVELARLES